MQCFLGVVSLRHFDQGRLERRLEGGVGRASNGLQGIVREALTKADGDKVIVTGRVPGEKVKPFNAAVAAVILMSPEDLDREEIKDEFDCDDAAI